MGARGRRGDDAALPGALGRRGRHLAGPRPLDRATARAGRDARLGSRGPRRDRRVRELTSALGASGGGDRGHLVGCAARLPPSRPRDAPLRDGRGAHRPARCPSARIDRPGRRAGRASLRPAARVRGGTERAVLGAGGRLGGTRESRARRRSLDRPVARGARPRTRALRVVRRRRAGHAGRLHARDGVRGLAPRDARQPGARPRPERRRPRRRPAGGLRLAHRRPRGELAPRTR